MVSYSSKVNTEETKFSYYTDIDFLTNARVQLEKANLIVGFNFKYDLNVLRRCGLRPNDRCRVWDCQTAEFIISGQKGSYPSLNECLAKYGLGAKDDRIAEYWKLGVDTTDIPEDELRVYGNLDVDLTYNLYLKQLEVMTDQQKKLCTVMGLDLLVLADMEWNGVKFDVEKCAIKADETAKDLSKITEELRTILNAPEPINLDSGHQLSCILYGGAFELVSISHVDTLIYKSGPRKGETYERNRYVTEVIRCDKLFEPLKGTATKLVSKADDRQFPIWATGEDVLRQLTKATKKHKRIIELLLKRAELAKLMDTYYGKLPALLAKMEWGEYLHGQYNQCVAATGRLSSNGPNMQNFSGDVDELLVSRYATG